MISYTHPTRPTTRRVPAGETVQLKAGESVTLTPAGAWQLVTSPPAPVSAYPQGHPLRGCFGCEAPTVWGKDCRYCSRYGRPCGRHDEHQH